MWTGKTAGERIQQQQIYNKYERRMKYKQCGVGCVYVSSCSWFYLWSSPIRSTLARSVSIPPEIFISLSLSLETCRCVCVCERVWYSHTRTFYMLSQKRNITEWKKQHCGREEKKPTTTATESLTLCTHVRICVCVYMCWSPVDVDEKTKRPNRNLIENSN